MLAMLQHPEVQERAQAEIDTVVGSDRLPNFDDRPNLPYVEAIWLETLRLYAVGPLGKHFDHDACIDFQVPLRNSPRYHG
jgi:cytochrome P450